MWEYVITVTPRQRDVAHCVRGRRRGKKRRMRRGGLYGRRGGAGGGRRRRGDTYVARARERVCVRLINQTFAFGCRGMRWRGREEEEPGGEREAGGRQWRPGRVEHEAEPGQAKSGSIFLSLSPRHAGPSSNLRYPHPASPSSLSPSRAISVSLLRARPSCSVYRSTESLSWCSFSVCLPACLCLPVGRLGPAFPPATPLALTLARCLSSPLYLSPAAAMYRWHGESTHQSADCGLLNARSHDPASGDVYTG